MNVLDILILVILAAFLVKGLVRGLIKELCSLLGLAVGALLAFRFHGPLAELLAESSGLPPKLSVAAAFIALFLGTVLFFAALGFLLSRFVRLVFLGGLNRVAGGFFGLAEGVILLALVLFTVSLADLPGSVMRTVRASQLAPPFIDLGKAAFQESRHFLSGRHEGVRMPAKTND